jgi:hypothetical protein
VLVKNLEPASQDQDGLGRCRKRMLNALDEQFLTPSLFLFTSETVLLEQGGTQDKLFGFNNLLHHAANHLLLHLSANFLDSLFP